MKINDHKKLDSRHVQKGVPLDAHGHPRNPFSTDFAFLNRGNTVLTHAREV